jgi:hypothetical protein
LRSRWFLPHPGGKTVQALDGRFHAAQVWRNETAAWRAYNEFVSYWTVLDSFAALNGRAVGTAEACYLLLVGNGIRPLQGKSKVPTSCASRKAEFIYKCNRRENKDRLSAKGYNIIVHGSTENPGIQGQVHLVDIVSCLGTFEKKSPSHPCLRTAYVQDMWR